MSETSDLASATSDETIRSGSSDGFDASGATATNHLKSTTTENNAMNDHGRNDDGPEEHADKEIKRVPMPLLSKKEMYERKRIYEKLVQVYIEAFFRAKTIPPFGREEILRRTRIRRYGSVETSDTGNTTANNQSGSIQGGSTNVSADRNYHGIPNDEYEDRSYEIRNQMAGCLEIYTKTIDKKKMLWVQNEVARLNDLKSKLDTLKKIDK